MPIQYRSSGSDFQIWLDQPIWVTDNTKQTRREVYPGIAEDITAWMRRKGYVMDNRWARGHKKLAQWVYAFACDEIREEKKGIAYPPILHRDCQEDYDQFHHVCDFFEIQELFDGLKTVEDFDSELPLGNTLLHNFADLLYTFLDLQASKQGRLIAQLYEDSDSSSESEWGRGDRRKGRKRQGNGRKVEDVYLQEARQGMHGGRGSKV
jgi:hypothetical protein